MGMETATDWAGADGWGGRTDLAAALRAGTVFSGLDATAGAAEGFAASGGGGDTAGGTDPPGVPFPGSVATRGAQTARLTS